MHVFVLDKHKKPLMPCTPRRARLLLDRNQAVVHRLYPFTIRLKNRLQENSTLQDVVMGIDPGSRTTGIAVSREEQVTTTTIVTVPTPVDATHTEPCTLVERHALHLSELTHRGQLIHEKMVSRSQARRRRRSKNLRYRQPCFSNRTRPKGWLPPSLQSRVDNIAVWARRYSILAPITCIDFELVRFDTQLMQDAEISGIEYQRGELAGYEVWEYLLLKWGHKCAYCGARDVPLVKEHINPKSRGGSNRVSNLCPACEPCNTRKGARTAAEFGYPNIQSQAKSPLRDAAAVNTTRYAVLAAFRAQGIEVRCFSGGRTKWNRVRLGLPKTHALDALCVGVVDRVTGVADKNKHDHDHALSIKAMGRGQHLRTRFNKYGFPRGYLTHQKRVFGFATGDLVRSTVASGKHAGVHVGRVAVRATGSFRVGTRDGIGWRNCQVLSRSDGYEYNLGINLDKNTNNLKRGWAPPQGLIPGSPPISY